MGQEWLVTSTNLFREGNKEPRLLLLTGKRGGLLGAVT